MFLGDFHVIDKGMEGGERVSRTASLLSTSASRGRILHLARPSTYLLSRQDWIEMTFAKLAFLPCKSLQQEYSPSSVCYYRRPPEGSSLSTFGSLYS